MNLFKLFKDNKEKDYAKPGRNHKNIERLQEIGRDASYVLACR